MIEWKDVNEELPEEYKEVLLCVPQDFGHCCGWELGTMENLSMELYWRIGGGYYKVKRRKKIVTHWDYINQPKEK